MIATFILLFALAPSVNGGIGTFMQPSAASVGGAPVVSVNITTQSAVPITTLGGSNLVTG